MPTHVTQQVRNYFTNTLRAAGFESVPDFRRRSFPVKVFESRAYALEIDDLPALAIFSRDEELTTREDRACSPMPQTRDILTSVVCVVASQQRGDDLIDNRLDDLALKVENEIFKDKTLGGIAHNTRLIKKVRTIDPDTDRPVGLLDCLFSSRVITLEGTAESTI